MTNRLEQVGISQRIRLEWLEETVGLVLAGNGNEGIHAVLNALLASKLSVHSKTVRGSRQKTITILTKVWHNVPPGLEPLRDAALTLHPRLDASRRQALHWGMTLAAYPFWGAVAEHTGRLLRLQGSVPAAQVQRRIRERYGERPTVTRATARILRSYVDWGVLVDTKAKGVYARNAQRGIDDAEVAAWLAEALLRSRAGNTASTASLLGHPALFPFDLPHMSGSRLARHSQRLQASWQGLDEDVLALGPTTTDVIG